MPTLRTALLLLLVGVLASTFSWRRWSYLLGPDPFAVPRLPPETRAERLNAVSATANTLDRIERPLPAGMVFNRDLADAFDQLRLATGLNLFVNWRSLEEAGFTRDTPVSADLGGMKLSDGLNHLLDGLSFGAGRKGERLGFSLDDDVVTISTRPDLDRNTLTKVYDVRDLVGSPTAAPFPLVAAGTAAPLPPGTAQKKLSRLTDKLTAIDPDSWRDNGGRVGSVRHLQGQLIVTQTPRNQRVIRHVLERERWRGRWGQFLVRAAPAVGASLAVASAAPLAIALRRRRARRMLAARQCVKCGYDLRATPDRCPECGMAVPDWAGGAALREPGAGRP